MKEPKKFMKKLIIPGVILALGLFTLIGARAGIFNGTKPKGNNGGTDAETRGTENNPFVILEIAPTLGSDTITWTSTNKTVKYDSMQVMRWGVGSEVADILTNQDLLHNTSACETLRDNGVVTLGTKVTGRSISESAYNSLSSAEKKYYTKSTDYKTIYKYIRRATNADTGTKLVLAIENVSAPNKNNSKISGFNYKKDNNGDWEYVSVDSKQGYMVYVGSGGKYTLNSPSGKYVAFINVGNSPFDKMTSPSPVLFVYEESASEPVGDGFDTIEPASGYNEYYIQYKSYEKPGRYTWSQPTTVYASQIADDFVDADYIIVDEQSGYVTTYTEADHYDSLTSTNLFADKVLHSTDPANCKVQVVSITAANLKSNTTLIDRADLIVINGDSSKNYGGYGDYGKDFDAATMLKIYSKASNWNLPLGNSNACPVIINNAILTKTPTSGSSYKSWSSAKYFKVFSDSSQAYYGSFTGFNNCVYRLALMLHVMDDENFVSIYLQNQLKTPRINSSTGEYVPAKVGSYSERLMTGSYYNTDSSSTLKTYWNANVFAPMHLISGNTETLSDDLFTNYGWRNDNTKTVVEDEYWLYVTTETDWMKYFYKDITNYKTSYTEGYTTEELFKYIYPTSSNPTSKQCSPLEIIDFLVNKGIRFVPTPTMSPTPSATPTITPTPFDISLELHAGDHGQVQAGTASMGKDSTYFYTVGWQEYLKNIQIECIAKADTGSHFVGWFTSEIFEGTAESTSINYSRTLQAVEGKKEVFYAKFVTNTPTPTATNTPTPTPTPRVEAGLRILEVQAYASFETDSTWRTMITNLYGTSSVKIATPIDRMTVKEFIGQVDELEDTYDLIYFGLKTNSYYTDWVKGVASTTWNYVYSHIGPKFYHGKDARRGGLYDYSADLTTSTSNLYTYLSGNDITHKKYLELKEFMNAKGVIVFASDFLKNGAFDTAKVDNSSYIYQLYNESKDKSNFVIYSKQTSTTKTAFVKNQKDRFVNIDLSVKPIEYTDTGTDESRYINGKIDSDRVLRYKFTIEDNNSITDPYYYDFGIYVDLNADGRFNSSEAEILKGATIIDKTTNKQLDEGQYLQSWHVYEVSRDVSELVGVIPWKIEIVRKDTSISTSRTGYSALKARDDERVTIRVLQIHQNGGYDSEKIDGQDNFITHLLPTRADVIRYAHSKITSTKFSSMSSEITALYNKLNNDSFKNPKFTKAEEEIIEKLYEKTNGSDLIKDYVKMYDSRGGSFYFRSDGSGTDEKYSTNGLKTLQKYYDLFKNLNEFNIQIDRMSCKVFNEWSKVEGNNLVDYYDMVILGFSDGYSDLEGDSSKRSAVKNLNDFINTGKSVMFAHDTTSHANVPDSKITIDGQHHWKNDWRWGYNINQMFRATLGMDRYNVKRKNATGFSSDPNYLQDSAWTTNNSRKSTVDGIQGYNDFEIIGCNKKSTQYTTSVESVNHGAITVYPYVIGDELTVSKTHSQYYQLDMENPNIVVWYTLAKDGVFANDPGDTQNGYYIYNIGNVTYTGAGHRVDDPSSNLKELKLFVNTVVSAYRAAGSPVDTYITNDEKTSGDNIDYLYIDFDSNDTTLAVGEGIAVYNEKQSKQVTFTVEDNSIIDTEKIEVNYYIQKSNIDMLKKTDLENPDYWDAVNFDTFNITGTGSSRRFGTKNTAIRTTGGRNYYTVLDRHEYGFYLPLELIESSSSMMVRIQTTITYGSVENGNLSTITTDKYVEVLRRGFFNLD